MQSTHRHRAHRIAHAIALAVLAAGAVATAAEPPAKRARPPKWPPEVRELFFDDARDHLVGPRPDYSAGARAAATSADSPSPQTAGSNSTAPAGGAWSKLIDADTIEAEIKRLAQSVAAEVETPTRFKGGGYQACRRDFSLLATWFAVAAEYDASVRWSDVAPALRDLFARAGYNCKVGTDQTFREASQRSQELADLIRGSRPPLAPAERPADWGQVADLAPLMQRLELAHQERLTQWLANERQFDQRQDEIRHEAQLVAAIAHVIGREGFDYWEDEEYAAQARALRQSAAHVAAATEQDNYQQAQQAISRATTACTKCHESYRG